MYNNNKDERNRVAILVDRSEVTREKNRNVSCEFFTLLNYHHVILILIF